MRRSTYPRSSPARGTAAGRPRPCSRDWKAPSSLTELGPRASTRLPAYQRLDFRASRTAGAFSFFVELFNLLGHENVTRVNTFEFQQDASGAVTASPVTESVIGILPSFGVTWRF